MKKNYYPVFASLSCLWIVLSLSPLCGQNFVKSERKDFEWRVIGRAMFDGGVFFSDKTQLGNAVQINDLRIGTQVRFLDHWEAKLEIGYAGSKVGLKDIYIDYQSGAHLFRLGHYFEPFGNARVGTANYKLMTVSGTDKALADKRKLGVTYSYNQKFINFMGGVFSDGDIDNTKPLNEGYTFAAKFVGRPLIQDKKLIHIGVAPRFSQHDQEENKNISFSAGAPTDLLTRERNNFIEAEVTNMINQWKLDLELIVLYNKWYLQSQYMMAHVNRFGAPDYVGAGGYVQAGYMILGEKHNYNPVTGMLFNPAPKSLEVICRYNLTDLTDRKAGVIGGKLSDITVGANYFINEYIAAKLNYAHVMVGNDAPRGAENFDLIQARVQFSF